MVMKVFRLFVVVTAASLIVWWLNVPFLESKENGGETIVTTTPILKGLIQNIVGPDVHVISLTEPGQPPNDQSLNKKTLESLASAKVLVINGTAGEPPLDVITPNISTELVIINMKDLLEKRLNVDLDYYWMSSSKYITAIEILQRELKKQFPKKRSEINYRKSAYIKTIFSKNEAMRKAAVSMQSDQIVIATNHPSFRLFVEDLNLKCLVLDLSGKLNEKVLLKIVDQLKEDNVKIIYPNDAISRTGLNELVEIALTQEWQLTIGRPILTLNLDMVGSGIDKYIQLLDYNFRVISDS